METFLINFPLFKISEKRTSIFVFQKAGLFLSLMFYKGNKSENERFMCDVEFP